MPFRKVLLIEIKETGLQKFKLGQCENVISRWFNQEFSADQTSYKIILLYKNERGSNIK